MSRKGKNGGEKSSLKPMPNANGEDCADD